MVGLLDMIGLGGGMPGLEAPSAGFTGIDAQPEDPMADRRAITARMKGARRGLMPGQEFAPFTPPQAGLLAPTVGVNAQGFPAFTPPAGAGVPPGPAPAAPTMPGQPSGGLLAAGYGGGQMGAPPAMLENKPPAPPPGAAPPAAPPSAVPPNLLARLGGFLSQHSNQLMGLGAGLAGGRSIGEGVSKGLTGAMSGREADIGQSSQNATYDALINKGVPPAQAMSAIGNPEMLKTLLAKHFSIPEFKTITNPVTGQSQLVLTDAAAGTAQAPTALPAGKSGSYRGKQAVFQNGQWYYTD
jgi:hypothetical protein